MLGMTALPHLGGFYGGYITRKEVKNWYPTLQKPSWRPPNAAFPVVWTCLYTGMGYGSYLVWKELGGFTEDAVALIEIMLLTGTVGATMVSWYSISRTATLLMAPYLSWLCLATSLNYCIWRDNPRGKRRVGHLFCVLRIICTFS
ncbi:Translocator protein [Nibea albiflora]|uniref:Translocator protein n=1 Tax=Nibea albiflora TaxID=240163 RepID=A0ACB7F0Q9_NIBAL|nr:Translocator protein [Nibea albiflora]